AGPLAARERAHRLPLLVAVEEEALEVAPHLDRLPAHVDARSLVGHVVEDRRRLVELGAVLIEIGDLRVLAEHDLALAGRELAEDGPEQGGLADAVPPHDAEPLARRED